MLLFLLVAATPDLDSLLADRVVEQSIRERLTEIPPELRTSEYLEREVKAFEAWKLETTVSSGVVPKRYFGYVDGVGDTADEERVLRETTIASVAAINAWQADRGSKIRITEQEVVVTFLAEGGALWLGRRTELHPVMDVGLDDIASGTREYADLMAEIDATAGTGLGELVVWAPKGTSSGDRLIGEHDGQVPYLVRDMTLAESVAGTALMWVWEKEIAAKNSTRAGYGLIDAMPLREQFIAGSLVYNSGDVHSPTRWRQIRDFDTAQVIWDKSEANARSRWRLEVFEPPMILRELAADGYPEQPTAWLAMYHVLQRYGAFEALSRFTDVFEEDGAFVR
ncbi:MAG: hypothetical protein GY913_01730 [Proteobacteria bacterium]|nr:hypothetical protein [Pseudomonadota bacterium]MCP4915620.1 hypothetical protein [Pseudomonadota bacterium]